MRLARIVAAALAVAVLHIAPLPAQGQGKDTLAPVCRFTVVMALQEIAAGHIPFLLLEGAPKRQFMAALNASTARAFPVPRRVLLFVVDRELYFGLETADHCLTPRLPLTQVLPDQTRSGRDALGTHA